MFKKRIKSILVLFFITTAILTPLFFISAEEPAQPEELKINLIYFYSKTCSHCKKIKPFIDRMEKMYGEKIDFKRYEISESQENRELFVNFLDDYGIGLGQGVVPTVFIDSVAIMEDTNIEMYLEGIIGQCVLNTCHLENDLDDMVGGLIPASVSSRSKLSIPLIVGAAFIDSINPCAIAVLLFLVAFLVAIKMTKRRMLLIGGIYIFTVMIVYIAAGFGLLKFISFFNAEKIINYIAAGILIAAGFISIKDFYWPDRGLSLKIPDRIKPKIERYLTNATIPSVIIAGILVAAFELPCTGEVYLGILSLMSQESGLISSIFYLILYNFIFVLPLIIILILAAAGLNMERIEQVRYERRRWLKLLLGLGMLILAAWLIL